MNIGEVATTTGVSAKRIRWYEANGLLPQVNRTGNNYRHYNGDDLHRVRIIGQARDVGMSVKEIQEMLAARDAADILRKRVSHLNELIKMLEAA